MPLDDGLTPEEQRFFETGQLDVAATAAANPGVDQVALAGLGQPEPTVQQPVQQPVQQQPVIQQQPTEPQLPDVAEIMRKNWLEAQQRVAELEAAARAAKPPTNVDPGPDPNVDPLGALLHKMEQLNAQVDALKTHSTQSVQQQQQLAAFNTFKENVNALKLSFAEQHPDFDAAYTHVRNQRIADLQAFGLNQQKINEILFREEVTLSENAINQGKNPAAVIYDMARRHGYAPPTTPNPATTTPNQKIDQIAAAQAAARTVPAQPTAAEDITMETLKNASDTDLNKMVMDEKTWAKISGQSYYPL